ncbi:MAG: class I SAM-dependent methyltransferase [Omnitrophica bacterium]|nr:class I SAM-dependent methyltransferase [Candidatus Omnitrophota bacterium]
MGSAGSKLLSDELESLRWPYYLIIPVTYLLIFWTIVKKKINAILNKDKDVGLLVFDGIGKYGKIIKRNVTGWKAVDLIYNHRFGENQSLGGRLDDFWFNSLNCQAARNRFKLAKRELEKGIFEFSNEKEVRIISLAAGTGQIECETIAKVKGRGVNVKAILIDREPDAINRAREYISMNGVQDNIKTINSDADSVVDVAKDFKPHIIKMIAFLDYFFEKQAINFISDLNKLLPPKGIFIVSNTLPNIEMYFVKWVVGWPLIYRKPKEIINILKKSGFTNPEVMEDPLHIQGVAVARK